MIPSARRKTAQGEPRSEFAASSQREAGAERADLAPHFQLLVTISQQKNGA
jgi:hypothetical protein